MSDIRTSLLGGSSSANNFSINTIDNVTTTTLSSNYPSGKYSLLSSLADSSVDVYAYNSAGDLVGTSSGLTLTTTGEFNKVVILGGTATDLISFLYNQSGFVSTATSSEITAAATISSISPSFVNTVNTESYIIGSNFASDVAVYFKGIDGVERAADSVTRNSATSLTITSPDTLPTEHSPYSIVVENPGVARPTKSNSHILQDAVNAAGTNLGWTRPADWITLTAPASNEQKFVGLLGISNDNSNYVALLAQGNYTVDWGDGVTENFTSNTKASHQYTYSSISSTVTSDGFKQVLVTVTPQAGQNLTMIDLQQTFTRTSLGTSAQIPWLDIAIAGTNLTTIKLTGSTSPTFIMGYLQRVNIVSSNLTSYASLFAYCLQLKNFTVNSNSTITNTSSMFDTCISLESVPLFVTSSVTSMSTMFYSCYSLKSVPLFNTSSVTNMSNMFEGCYSLNFVPLFNTSSVTNMSSMFSYCRALESVPLFNTASVTNMSGMFSGCASLKSVPLFNTASVTSMSSMFFYCLSLKSVPLFNTASVTTMSSMFSDCFSLKSVPLFNTASVTTMSTMFDSCVSLESIPLFNTASVVSTGFQSFAAYTFSLKSLTISNSAHTSITNLLSSSTSLTSLSGGSVFGLNSSSTRAIKTINVNCSGLVAAPGSPPFSSTSFTNVTSIILTGLKYAVSIAGMRLNGAALDALYTSLGTAAGAQTLTVTTNHGTVDDTPSIATAKGWTVSGS